MAPVFATERRYGGVGDSPGLEYVTKQTDHKITRDLKILDVTVHDFLHAAQNHRKKGKKNLSEVFEQKSP